MQMFFRLLGIHRQQAEEEKKKKTSPVFSLISLDFKAPVISRVFTGVLTFCHIN